MVDPSTARARVAAPRARPVQVVAFAESEQAADKASAAAPDAAPAAQSDIPSSPGESQVVNALRVLHQIQFFFSIRPSHNFPTDVFVLRNDLEPIFFRQFSKVLFYVLQEVRSFRSLYTD